MTQSCVFPDVMRHAPSPRARMRMVYGFGRSALWVVTRKAVGGVESWVIDRGRSSPQRLSCQDWSLVGQSTAAGHERITTGTTTLASFGKADVKLKIQTQRARSRPHTSMPSRRLRPCVVPVNVIRKAIHSEVRRPEYGPDRTEVTAAGESNHESLT